MGLKRCTLPILWLHHGALSSIILSWDHDSLESSQRLTAVLSQRVVITVQSLETIEILGDIVNDVFLCFIVDFLI